MKNTRFTIEKTIWLIIFVAAIFFRVVQLDNPALNDTEAQLSMQALHLAQGERTLVSENPLYVIVSGLLFFLFDASPFLARLLPFLAGVVVIAVLYLSRQFLGKEIALLAASLMTIDPAFVAVSRQVDSPIMGILFLLLFFVLLEKNRAIMAGMVLGLGLLSGIHFWQGILYLIIVVGLWRLLLGSDGNAPWFWFSANIKTFCHNKGWIGFLGVVFLLGTLMLTIPGGAGEMLSGLSGYIASWGEPYSNYIVPFIVLLPAYELLPLLLGLIYGIFSALHGNRIGQFLLLFWLVALILTLAYPGRNMLDMAWVVLPLLVLAAGAIYELLTIAKEDWLPSIGLGVVVAILVAFAIYSSLMLVTLGSTGREMDVRIISLAGALIVAAVLIGMMAWAWSGTVGIAGMGLGLLSLGIIFTISQAWRTTGLAAHPTLELWRNSPRLVDTALLPTTIKTIGTWNNGEEANTPIAVVDLTSPSLQWALRDLSYTQYYSTFPIGENPEIVLTKLGDKPASSDSYTGQDFVWKSDATWSTLTAQEWMNWFLRRKIPSTKEEVILWARTDILPAGKADSGGTP